MNFFINIHLFHFTEVLASSKISKIVVLGRPRPLPGPRSVPPASTPRKWESQREIIFNSERCELSVFSFVLKSRHFDKRNCRHLDKIVETNNSSY